jgi:hypothetical protein
MAANSVDREILTNFVANQDPEELNIFLELADLAGDYNELTVNELLALTESVLADIPSY